MIWLTYFSSHFLPHLRQVELDHLHEIEQRFELRVAAEIVQRQAEAHLLEFLAAADDLIVDLDGFEQLDDDFVLRQQLDHVGQQQVGTDIDETFLVPEHAGDPQFAEGVGNDVRRGHHVVGYVGAEAVTGRTKQQFVGNDMLISVEDRLATEKDVLEAIGHKNKYLFPDNVLIRPVRQSGRKPKVVPAVVICV